jgi:uncharacterized protein YkuJ
MTVKSWGVRISGPVLAVAAISLGTLAAVYAGDPSAALRIVRWSAIITGILAVILIFVAQYDVWKKELELTERREAELEKALLNGPEVWLGFNNIPLEERFYAKNASQQDAALVSIDPFETPRYRAECEILAAVRHSERPQVFTVRMTDKKEHIEFMDLDIAEMLEDSAGGGLACSLEFTLRYSDPWGKRFKRRATLKVDRIRLDLANLPPILNHPIEIDRDAS